jgi:sec-independent protein translocase protein TatC
MPAGTDDAVGGDDSSAADSGQVETGGESAVPDDQAAVPDGGSPAAGDDGVGGGGALEGAPDDEEMPLTEHIEEMIRRLGAVLIVMAGVSAIAFILPHPSEPAADRLVNLLWYSYLPGSEQACAGGEPSGSAACPRVYHPLGLVFTRIKVASLLGLIVALPVFVYQSYLFMRPGLYPNERRYYLASVPTSLILALVGVAFAYFLVLPLIFSYFLFYSEGVADIAFGLQETFNLILLMMGMFAVIFQIPLFIMLAIMMGVTSRRWLEQRRLLFWGVFLGFAFIFNPDLTGMAPLIVTATMIFLFEGTLALLRWTGR